MKLIIATFLFYVGAANALELCQNSWETTDREAGISPHLKSVCVLESTDQSYALEVVLYQKHCQRFEGGAELDCFFVRDCRTDQDQVVSGLTIYDIPEYTAPLCATQEQPMALLDSSSGARADASAVVVCDSKRPTQIKLTIGNRELLCPYPFDPNSRQLDLPNAKE